ncbi:hypothetical protein GIB67_002054 [Kingdonia uniflora]|uniref:Uncharacterized protein n=1 Tax=Kingdonia uniflora TaxID=39325 RepID=A0A7J7KWA8_9MAGN|nr:hypothetical protein GIB67_002054 [Kingdonia uniflora]
MEEIEILSTKRISVRDLWMHFYVSKNLRCRMTVYLDPLLLEDFLMEKKRCGFSHETATSRSVAKSLTTTRIVAINAYSSSGGKDLTVPAFVLSELYHWHNYGLDLFLLSIDEGITGYRDDSLETVKRNEVQYGLPLKVVSYKDLYGWTMDDSEDDRTEK